VQITLSPQCSARIKVFDYNFGELAIKGRGANGNIVTRYPIKKIVQKSVGDSTMGGRKIYLDETIGRLNTEKHGRYLGSFNTDDTILVVYKDGSYEQTSFDLTNHYDMRNIEVVTKLEEDTVVTALYLEGESKLHYVKRFRIETSTIGKRFTFISETPHSKLVYATVAAASAITLSFTKGKKTEREDTLVRLDEFIDVKGWKAIGNKLTPFRVLGIEPVEVEQPEQPQSEEDQEAPEATAAAPAPAAKPVSIWQNLDSLSPAAPKPLKKREQGEEDGVTAGETVDFDEADEEDEAKPKKKKQLNLF
jgi:topoisomerase-4 subunit A